MEQQWVTYNNVIKRSLNMADFLWIVSNSNDVIRENTSASFSKGTGEEKKPANERVSRRTSQNLNLRISITS
jgi:hypothetical protein